MINVITEHKHTLSLDRLQPIGAKQDNHSNKTYISQIKTLVKDSYLDLGCAGGQTVIDMSELGYDAVGIDGCGIDQILKKSINPDINNNWTKYFNKNLFEADIAKPFYIEKDTKPFKFDLITAWDFLEHPKEEEIPVVIENIKRHLKPEGWFLFLISKSLGTHHQCVKEDEWWKQKFEEHGFYYCPSPITSTPRNPEYNKIWDHEFFGAFRLVNK